MTARMAQGGAPQDDSEGAGRLLAFVAKSERLFVTKSERLLVAKSERLLLLSPNPPKGGV